MLNSRLYFFFLLISFSYSVAAQKLKKSDRETLEHLKSHVSFLSDDKLEGRRAGTPGEDLARNYISDQFKQIGLTPKGEDGYFQSFPIYDGKQVDKKSFLFIDEHEVKPIAGFFPLPFSPDKTIEAFPAVALKENDMPWFEKLSEIMKPHADNPHLDPYQVILEEAKNVAEKGATALILYSLEPTVTIDFDSNDKTEIAPIPVLFVKPEMAKKYFADETASVELKFRTLISDKMRTGHNVIGFIDNGAANTVILGAHFDHLGFGEDGNSMVRSGPKQIHNGADDNASGTAALIELARKLKEEKKPGSNYLFIAFSGEELGLFGSKYYVEHPTIDLSKANYMINMDMVGRLNDSSRVVTVGGFGTSPSWASLLTTDKRTGFTIKKDSSGTGPSDHTSFYRHDIPVLFFFTGLHQDYHRPSDDADKINYEGEVFIVNYITSLIEQLDKQGNKIAFEKTRETQTSTSTRFKVTLGVMPDYTFNGPGMRIDAVTEGRPAANAGIQAGDVITQLGETPVTSMETYMQALGKFNKGEKTTVKFKRGEAERSAEIVF